jgi:hypothetical protein
MMKHSILSKIYNFVGKTESTHIKPNHYNSLKKLTKSVWTTCQKNQKPFLPSKLSNYSDLEFAIRHSLHIFNKDAIYTFIPKNACSTMRYSIALNNGFIRGIDEAHWIHTNNLTLTVKDINILTNPKYSFVILRCPYQRLVSVFLDKFVKGGPIAIKFAKKYISEKKLEEISFQDFARKLEQLQGNFRAFDHHWRPQSDCLIYEKYDRYFAMEDFEAAVRTLEQDIDFKIHDSRQIIQHHTSNIRKAVNIQEPWLLNINQMRNLKAKGLPSARDMYSQDLVNTVRKIYQDDIDLYTDKFEKQLLLF